MFVVAYSESVRVEQIRVDDVDDGFIDAWRQLAADAVEPNPFHLPELLLPAARRLVGGAAVELLTAWSGERMAFLLPVQSVRQYRRVPLRTLTWWRHPYAYLSTPLVGTYVDAHDAWSAALAHVSERRAASWLALELFPLDGPVAAGLLDRPGATTPVVFERYDRPIVDRRAEPTYLEGSLGARHAKNLRRYRRRLTEELGGPVERSDRAQAGDDVFTKAVEGFLDQEAAGWKGQDGGAFACDPAHADFFRETTRELRRAGQLELWAFGSDDRAAAYQCNLVAPPTTFHWKVSYDESLGRWSPGLQLEIEMVDAFHDDPRLNRIDSCTAAGANVSAQLYPDRRPVGNLVVPLRGGGPRLVATAMPRARRAYRAARARLDRRSADTSPET